MSTSISLEPAPLDFQKAPYFSIIVPVYEQWGLVPKLLSCVKKQALSQEFFEIILVDNGSADFEPPAKMPSNATILSCETEGSYAARNYGAQHARGEWFVFTDADCLPSPEWLQTLYEAASQPDNRATLLAGPVEIVSVSKTPGPYEIYDMLRGIPQSHYVERGFAATANLTVPRSLFECLDGFDEKRFSGGDKEFCWRAGAKGHQIKYIPHACVGHPARAKWKEVSTKARRLKGGQLTAGSTDSRRRRVFATLRPPVPAARRLLQSGDHPLRYRLIAVFVLFRIWTVELRELIRLSLGAKAERR